MSKIMSKIVILMLVLISVIGLPTQLIYANETSQNIENSVKIEFQSNQQARIPNIIEVKATKMSDDKVKITVFNLGIDVFDSVSCSVKITDKNGIAQYNKTLKFTDILPLINQSETISIKNWSKVSVTNIQCKDGTDSGKLANFTLENKN